MDRYVCIHGHFYQPPRENPWLEAIELQDSAYPYHDWNERITAECYAPNSASRILDADNRITDIVNNYARMSFNFGPTLLSWMEHAAPEVYEAILAADVESQRFFSGHGSAIAQCYNHSIMPLNNPPDKLTQVRWGIRDFKHRFARMPEGMWLPETSVDIETLETLASEGINFTILAPHQARRVRPLDGSEDWEEVNGGGIDPSRAYLARLPSGRSIVLFFYDGPISRAVAFEGLLSRGEDFVNRLRSGFDDRRTWPQLTHIATDGESYGHHHRFGDMALAYLHHHFAADEQVRLTNYSEFLALHPPTHEVEIAEETSWSCAHGIERWRSNCGCNSGGQRDWNQEWRAPLRAALDWLRDSVNPLYEERAARVLRDPWAARDDYIDVILDRSPESQERFFELHGAGILGPEDRRECLELLELQRHLMLMYTSCGWFFNELSGIETVQIIQYAGRALQLAQDLFGDSLEEPFLEHLQEARSNLPEHRDGRAIYDKFVRPAKVDLLKVGAHYALSALFEPYPEQARIYAYLVDNHEQQRLEAGRAQLLMGRATLTSVITTESEPVSYAVLHLGDHNLTGGVRSYHGPDGFELMRAELEQVFQRADFPEAIRVLDKHYADAIYSVRSLFRDEQRHITEIILQSTLEEMAAVYRQQLEYRDSLLRFLAGLSVPMPTVFRFTAQMVLNNDLQQAFEEGSDIERVRRLLSEAQEWHIELDQVRISYALTCRLDQLAEELTSAPRETATVEHVLALVEIAHEFNLKPDLWRLQNAYHGVRTAAHPHAESTARRAGHATAREMQLFDRLGQALSFYVP